MIRSWYKKLALALGVKFDLIAVGLLGGMYIKGDHNGVIGLALEKLKRREKNSDDLYIKYYIGYALASLQHAKNDKQEMLVRDYMVKHKVSENECMSYIQR